MASISKEGQESFEKKSYNHPPAPLFNEFLNKLDQPLATLTLLCEEYGIDDPPNVFRINWDGAEKKYYLFIDHDALLGCLNKKAAE